MTARLIFIRHLGALRFALQMMIKFVDRYAESHRPFINIRNSRSWTIEFSFIQFKSSKYLVNVKNFFPMLQFIARPKTHFVKNIESGQKITQITFNNIKLMLRQLHNVKPLSYCVSTYFNISLIYYLGKDYVGKSHVICIFLNQRLKGH